MAENIDKSFLSLAYDKWFTLSSKIFVGYVKPNSDKSFDIDIIIDNEMTDTFKVKEVSFIQNRYLILSLVDNKESEIEVIDTVTNQKLTDKIFEKKHHKMLAGFVCENGGIPYATIYTNEKFGRCLILNNNFEIINSDAIGISNPTSGNEVYSYGAILHSNNTKWKHIIMDKTTGEVLEQTDYKSNT